MVKLNNKTAKIVHSIGLLLLLPLGVYSVYTTRGLFMAYFVSVYFLAVIFFFWKTLEIRKNIIVIKYPLRPFYRYKKKDINSLTKISFALDGVGGSAISNIKFWFSKFYFIEIRLYNPEKEIKEVINFLNTTEASFKIKCTKHNREYLKQNWGDQFLDDKK